MGLRAWRGPRSNGLVTLGISMFARRETLVQALNDLETGGLPNAETIIVAAVGGRACPPLNRPPSALAQSGRESR